MQSYKHFEDESPPKKLIHILNTVPFIFNFYFKPIIVKFQ